MSFSMFEVMMLICFGCSWPFAIIKTVRVKNPAGKSYFFLFLVIIGYIAGCLHKILYQWDWVFWLYLTNAFMVSLDTGLCLYYQRRCRRTAAEA